MEFIQILLLILLGIPTLYIFLFALAGLFYTSRKYPRPSHVGRFAVLIPGYREDDVIVEVAADALKQNYPPEHYDIIVIADSFKPETLALLRQMPIRVLEVAFEKSTKAKALNKAMEQLEGPYDYALILDADNLMAPDFLEKLHAAFCAGVSAIQGHRTSKNMNTSFAILDSVSEEINNHIFRKGHRVLGLSSAIIGSGMAFRYGLFKDFMSGIQAVGGFDKELELKLLQQRHLIEYLDDALVYDEKVQKGDVFGNQRRRWLSAQFHYLRTDFFPAFLALVRKGNMDYFDKAFQFLQPPRILLLGADLLAGLGFVVYSLVWGHSGPLTSAWIILVTTCILAFVFSVPPSFYTIRTLKALGQLPKGMFLMLRSLLTIRGANKKFIHTRHNAPSSLK